MIVEINKIEAEREYPSQSLFINSDNVTDVVINEVKSGYVIEFRLVNGVWQNSRIFDDYEGAVSFLAGAFDGSMVRLKV